MQNIDKNVFVLYSIFIKGSVTRGGTMKTKLLQINNNRGILVDKKDNKGNKIIVIMIGGFERAATTEKKFKKLADNLSLSSFRFDWSGIGLSDGEFSNVTVSSMKKELNSIVKELGKNYKRFMVVAHSLGCCVVADMEFEKKVLIAPALNQKELLRYYFVVSNFKEKEITWDNYRRYLNERKFLKYCKKEDKMTKKNFIGSDYFIENKDKDYSKIIKNNKSVLHIHGDKDDKVPIESLNVKFINSIIVKGGDHDLERPDMMEQWLPQAIKFIEN